MRRYTWDGKASRATAISVGAGTSRRSGVGAGCFNIESRDSDKDSEKVSSKGGMAFYYHGNPMNSRKFNLKRVQE